MGGTISVAIAHILLQTPEAKARTEELILMLSNISATPPAVGVVSQCQPPSLVRRPRCEDHPGLRGDCWRVKCVQNYCFLMFWSDIEATEENCLDATVWV